MPAGETTTVDLVKQINTYIELNKPEGIFTTPVFFDWIDLQFKEITDESEDEYYQRMAPVYYSKPYNPAKNFNALPRSARKVFLLIIISFLLR
jgi:hypothetical protein